MTLQAQKRRFTVDEYHLMAEAGILSEDDRVELIDGEIMQMAPIGSRHAACVDRLTGLTVTRLAEAAVVRVQSPVRLGPHSEPQPDLALLRPRGDFYESQHPGPNDVLLIIEVAETSAEFDRQVKIPCYAKAGIPEVWLVDLPRSVIQVHRTPKAGGYQDVRSAAGAGHVKALALPQLELAAHQIIG